MNSTKSYKVPKGDDNISKSVIEQQDQLNRLYKESEEIYHAISLKFGLSDAAALIMYTLGDSNRSYSQKEFCEIWSLTKTTVNSALNNLLKSGYVTSSPSADNRRMKLVSLTEAGKVLAGEYAQPLIEAERKALERLSAVEREQLLRLSKKHLEMLREEVEKHFTD